MKRLIIAAAIASLLGGCVVEPARQCAPAPQYYQPNYQPTYQSEYQPPPQPVVSVYVEPPLAQPAPILVEWAPPPMLVELPPPMPYEGAIWTGGYWVWEGNWVWAHGLWAAPPRPGYGWVNPYYEHRHGGVVFVNGYWAAPGVSFAPPPPGISISIAIVAAGVVAGPRCSGPEGVFVPAPPGSRYGLIVPAPIGTSPAVVTSAPPIVNQGMHITTVNNSHNTTNSVSNVTNVNKVTNVTNVTIVAPPGATANGQGFNSSVPAAAHLAAALPTVVHAPAPMPMTTKPIPAYVAGHQPAFLPPPQVVRPVAPPSFTQGHPAVPATPQPKPAPVVTQQVFPQPVQHVTPAPETRYQPNESRPLEQKPEQQRSEQHEQRPQQIEQRPQPKPTVNVKQNEPQPAAQPQYKEKKPERSEKDKREEHDREHPH